MKPGTFVHHVHGYKLLPQIFKFVPRDLVMVFQIEKTGKIITKIITKTWKIITHAKSLGKS